ncbi:MlaD family protein [Lacihabitans sp. CS3-21]|uniref:MlaD family protein n=1 Tax=Lacihabitans sp. CS3-21 TaxID=2487332 RepID=UPI0020CF7603|nr:MlaD family protein [Lacihabitans sp. CS3-21]MCP9746817.1 MCE family protein [Lacihabitans sp. CS3-21]
MKALKNNRPVIVGMFILLGLLILVMTVFTLGNQKKTFVKTFTLYAVFDNVGGLLKGGNVWLSGVKIGTIKRISFYGDSKVIVTMSIEQEAEAYIHKNAKAKIGSDGLIGNKIVIIYGGDKSVPQVVKGDVLKVENGISTDDMMATLQENNKNILQITHDFKSISKKIDNGEGALATLLNDPAIANQLRASTSNLQSTLTNLKTVSEGSKKVLANLEGFSKKLVLPGNSVNDIASDTIIYKSLKATLAELNDASKSVTKFTENLKTASEKFGQKDNAVGVLLNDSETAAAMKTTLKNLEAGSKKLDEDLEALQHNFLLRRFFKKKAKNKL